MTTIFQNKFVSKVVRQFKQLAGSMSSEKPDSLVEDYVLEHFLLYHGLVGSMPENQRQFDDIRADIRKALSERSSVQLCIALKLPPLWW
jgi:hypothetical protein